MKTFFTCFILILGISASAQIDDCCINPDWIDPNAMCPFLWDPVIGCDGVEYANSCVAENSGVTSWSNAAGLVNSLDWDCGQNSGNNNPDNCCINPAWINPSAMCITIWDPVIGCDGIEYSNSCGAQAAGVSSWTDQTGVETVLNWDCEASGALCTSWSGIEIYEEGMWVNPNDPCDMGECTPNGEFYGIAIDCASWFGEPCNGEWVNIEGECCPVCVEAEALCTSYSGIEIYESGEWANPNDPCDFGFCGEDGFFSGVIIDCPEQMGMPCDGQWVLEDGACCSTCVENTNSDCGSISITLNNGWNMIGFACSENTNALVAFAAIQDKIVIAKDGVGNAYLPDWDFNGIGDLERGYGYLIKVSEEITNYNICD